MQRHAIPDIDVRTRLAERGLECHILLRGTSQTASDWKKELCLELKSLLKAAYGQEVTEAHLQYETWAVVTAPSSSPPVACSTLSFYSSLPCGFVTHFEAVHPSLQKTGLGRLLYDCLAVWARFLVFNDVLVQEGVANSDSRYFLVSYIDADDAEEVDEGDCWDARDNNVQGHGTFLRKLGFVRAQHYFGQTEDDVAFQREFSVPVEEP